FRGPGHGDVFSVGGVDRFAHHYYDATDDALPKLSVRPITWTAGWPSLGDPLSGNRGVGHGNAYLSIVDRNSGAVLANPSCGYEGADIRLDTASPEACRQWRPEERGDGWSSLLNKHSNKVVEVAACVNADGARVAQWGWLDNDCQKFRFTPAGQGFSRIENKLANRVLAPAGCGAAGTAVQTVTWTGAACQQFRLDPVGDVLLSDRTNTDILTGSACGSSGKVVVEQKRRAGTCQLWRFQHVRDGYHRIVHRQSGRALAVTGASGISLVKGAAAGQWRIEPLNDGTYRLVDAAGAALQFDHRSARPGVPGASADQQVKILVP
ncbi:MAG TPA: RICIN domain-containing protein, partial [Actinoplanes sp.]